MLYNYDLYKREAMIRQSHAQRQREARTARHQRQSRYGNFLIALLMLPLRLFL